MKTILVVDDLRDLADSIALVLTTHGYEVQVAYDAEQALACVAERCPDLVVLDLTMPVVSGYAVARRLRASHGSIPYLVAHTAWDDDETKDRAAAARFDAHLRKPASVSELISAIE